MPKLKTINRDTYFSIISTSKHLKGDTLLKLEGKAHITPDKYSIQVSEHEHLLPYENTTGKEKGLFIYINHSCNPNAFFDIQKRELIALRDIQYGEEVVYNYNTTEYDMSHPFICSCKNNNCIKEIKGFKYLTSNQKKELISYLSPHLKKYI